MHHFTNRFFTSSRTSSYIPLHPCNILKHTIFKHTLNEHDFVLKFQINRSLFPNRYSEDFLLPPLLYFAAITISEMIELFHRKSSNTSIYMYMLNNIHSRYEFFIFRGPRSFAGIRTRTQRNVGQMGMNLLMRVIIPESNEMLPRVDTTSQPLPLARELQSCSWSHDMTI